MVEVSAAGAHPGSSRDLEIEVMTDAPSWIQPLLARMAASGFTRHKLTMIPPEALLTSEIALRPGPLGAHEVDVSALLVMMDEHVRALGIDCLRYPVRRHGEDEKSVRMILPVGACVSGARPAYAGVHPDRFEIRAETDDRDLGDAVVDRLADAGFRIFRRALTRTNVGFSIQHPDSIDGRRFADLLRRFIEAEMKAAAGAHAAALSLTFAPAKVSEVTITLPLLGARSGALLVALSRADRFACKIHYADDGAAATALESRLESFGWGSLSTLHEEGRHVPRICYGGASMALVTRTKEAVQALFPGLELSLSRDWSESDHDVWIYLPSGLKLPAGAHAAPARAAASTAEPIVATKQTSLPLAFPAPKASGRPFVEVGDDRVRIGRHVLTRGTPHPLAPDPALAARYVVDQATAETLDHIAASAIAGEPCLIEGTTATSKTSAVMYVAALIRQPVIRLNLNGQTDTSELIGRFLPDQGGWRWQHGATPLAMQNGYWLLLDELNLCEANVAERLNSVLEWPPSLHLSECDGQVFGGASGDPVHPGFRVFASLNPAEGYVGRVLLSPAFKDRFVGFRRTRRASEADIRDQLVFLFKARQPEVVVDGVHYPAHVTAGAPLHGALAARLPHLDAVIDALARFHVGAEAVCDAPDGPDDRPVITRRSLLGALRSLEGRPATAQADLIAGVWSCIERYYLNRFVDPGMRKSVEDLATAIGFRPNAWSFT